MTPTPKNGCAAAASQLLGLAVLAGAGAVARHAAGRRKDAAQDRHRGAAGARWRTERRPLERGRYLFTSRGCAECHGANGGGQHVRRRRQRPALAGPHISPGPGSVTAAYQPEDWVRAIRHGVKPDGRPADDHAERGLQPLHRRRPRGAGGLHPRSMPPAGGGAAVIELPLPVRVLYGLGADPRRRRQDRPHACRRRSRCPKA